MATVKIYKETTLPGTLQANSVYLIAPAGSPNYVEMYVTGTSAATVKRILNEADIQAMITASLSGIGATEIVADITARNALTPSNGSMCLVLDASADPTVTSGAATYIYQTSTTTWIKIAEYESLDFELSWANLSNKPTSSVADIDDAVSKRHAHTNKTQLDKVGENVDGLLTYNGLLPKIAWDSTSW
jgi:hypothetical protein